MVWRYSNSHWSNVTRKMKDAIIIPAYNEGSRIVSTLNETKKIKGIDIIVVDDGSSDDTKKQAESKKVTVLHHIINLGKGAAVKTGCDYALKKGYKNIILMDADGQHEPKDIPRFQKELQKYDIIFGYRKTGKAPVISKLGNFGLTIITQILFGMKIYDTQSGFRAFTSKAYKKIRWKSTDYTMESEMIFRAKGLRYKQIPIKTIYHDTSKGTTVIDGIKIGFQMLKIKIFG